MQKPWQTQWLMGSEPLLISFSKPRSPFLLNQGCSFLDLQSSVRPVPRHVRHHGPQRDPARAHVRRGALARQAVDVTTGHSYPPPFLRHTATCELLENDLEHPPFSKNSRCCPKSGTERWHLAGRGAGFFFGIRCFSRFGVAGAAPFGPVLYTVSRGAQGSIGHRAAGAQ